MVNYLKHTFLVSCIIISPFIIFLPPAYALFAIDLNYYSIDFGGMDMGDIKDDVPSNGLIVTLKTDQGNPWFLRIRTDMPLTHVDNPSQVIPDTHFRWYGVSTSDVTNTTLVTSREDLTVEKTVYSGAAAETETDVTLKFELMLPALLQSGTYETTVVLTLTE